MKYFWLICFLISVPVLAQKHHPQNGVSESTAEYYAFKNARIIVGPNVELEKGSMLIKDGEIVDIGRFISIPKGSVIIDCEGKTILPSFIELNSQIGISEPKAKPWNFRPQLDTDKKGSYYWNESIHPEFNATTEYQISDKDIKEAQKMGFGIALSHIDDGIAQGTGVLVSLTTNQNKAIHSSEQGSFFSLVPGVSRQSYPSSQMGALALTKQVFHDLEWYEKGLSDVTDLSLEALSKQHNLAQFFSVREYLEISRIEKIAKEFGREFIYLGNGDEYRAIEDLKVAKNKLVIPINFPVAYDVQDPYLNRFISLEDLKHWELAPHNPRLLSESDVPFCITAKGNENASEFWGNIQKMIEAGLSKEKILEALTTTPAKWIGIENEFGRLEKGMAASFNIYDNHPLEQKSTLLEAWIKGEQNVLENKAIIDIRGDYNLVIASHKFPISISGTEEKPKGKITLPSKKDTTSITPYISIDGNNVVIQFTWKSGDTIHGSVNLKGKYNQKVGVFEGSGQLPNGQWSAWSGIKNKSFKDEEKPKLFKTDDDRPVGTYFPSNAFGFENIPQQQNIIIQNATLWTNEETGIVEKGSVAIVKGKIVEVGQNLSKSYPNAKIINGEGMHLTPGIIDEHSHIAISKGVNEGGQAISAEVSIGDVVNPTDINIYRQLSGGVTAAQLLHGSANPIGGQSGIIKLKWGHNANEMLVPNGPKFIKFALGENVKQSNWGDFSRERFPQTRMGVEQVYYDGFNRALAYDKEKKTGNYRHDLELETLLEIINGERHISCHSYIQSEINMLMKVADSFGFKINTFTHILEGYKVADKMAKHGAGGSTFADWWAYKYEVRDAIPYNASLMMSQGVTVAINSDDAEMGRRLNQEAAKGIKYGGMTEEQALKMVTLNPAKLLHLDDRMGSLKVGKDADVVLWSDHPLSVKAKAMYTIVDGEILFDRELDKQLQLRDAQEKARIISLMLVEKEKGAKTKKFAPKKNRHFHCNTLGEEASTEENAH